MNEYVILDQSFVNLVNGNARLERLFTGCRWAEGPVWFRDADMLLWSDIPNNRILRLAGDNVDVYRKPSNNSNGNTRDPQGRLVSCEHGGRRVTRTEHDGTITVIADNYRGKRLNSPNDVVAGSDGSIWFTDPSYGIMSDYEGNRGDPEYGGCHVFRADPDGGLTVVADDFMKPNGLAFSPDESALYIADTGRSHDPAGPAHIRRFGVGADNTLSGGEVFCECSAGLFDGFRFDTDGRIWTSAADGIHCIDADGRLIGKILVPEVVSNLTFGGPKRNRLYITATTSIYSVFVMVTGAQTP